MSATRPPLDYLVTCSQMSLESVELSRLNLASNLRKEFQQILEEWIDTEVDARLARSVLDWRRSQSSAAGGHNHEPHKSSQFQQLAIAFLPEKAESPAGNSPEHDPRFPQVDARVERLLPTEVAQPNPSAPRWTPLARAAAATLGAVGGLEERYSKRLRGYRKIAPLVKIDRRPRHGSVPVGDFSSIRKHATVPIEFVPLRASDVRAQKTLKPSCAVRPLPRQANSSVAQAARTPSRCANAWRRWVASASRSGAGGALHIATGDAS
jgi:hypothetical protein